MSRHLDQDFGEGIYGGDLVSAYRASSCESVRSDGVGAWDRALLSSRRKRSSGSSLNELSCNSRNPLPLKYLRDGTCVCFESESRRQYEKITSQVNEHITLIHCCLL